MFIERNDLHKFYDFVNCIFFESKFNIKCLSSLTARYSLFLAGIEFKRCFLLFDFFYFIFYVYKNWKSDFIFVREFNTVIFFVNALFLLPFRRKIILNVNHNFQRACTSVIHKTIIIFLDRLGFRFFCFEDSSLCFTLRHKVIEIPFLVESRPNSLSENKPITIGVVGAVRAEKNIDILLCKLDEVKIKFPDVVFLLGSDDIKLNFVYEKKGWTVLDTTDYVTYISAIEQSDLLVFNYDKRAYYYRHSGVITDAILNGKVVVVPQYPYFVKQITNPVKVGVSFSSIDNISLAINDALQLLDSNNKSRQYELYCYHRSLNSIVSSLDEQLSSL